MRPVSAADVLEMLLPNGGWIIVGDDFDSIQYDEGVSPITKKQFMDGFDQVAAWKQGQETTRAQAKANLLTKLGITEDEARLLLS
jgi:hypothetical protein